MTPVILLSAGYIANAAEPWRLPDADSLPRFPVRFETDPAGFQPFNRDPDTLARGWAVPGTPGLEHRNGAIQKASDSGTIPVAHAPHQQKTDTRLDQERAVAQDARLAAIHAGGARDRRAVVRVGATSRA